MEIGKHKDVLFKTSLVNSTTTKRNIIQSMINSKHTKIWYYTGIAISNLEPSL